MIRMPCPTACACSYPQHGQAAVETLIVTLVLIAGFWGVGWLQGEHGAVARLVDALLGWHQRFAAALAVPG